MIFSGYYKKNESIESIAKGIILSFDGSPKHKEIMLCEDMERFKNIIGVSILIKEGTLGPNFDEYTINVDFGVYINLSALLKKWFGIVNNPLERFKTAESVGLKVFANIGFWFDFKSKSNLEILSPLIALYWIISKDSLTLP